MRTRCLALLLLTTAPVLSQRTWIVDSANGPGTDYLDIDDAYAASSRGDTIIVRDGNGLRPYDLPALVDRSIRIVAPGANPVPVMGRCQIKGVPSGDIVVLDNMDFATQSFGPGVPMSSCQGLVLMSRMYASPEVHAAAGFVSGCARVVLTRFRETLAQGPVLYLAASRVWLIDSEIRGLYSGRQLPAFWGAAYTDSGALWMIGCRVEGGQANPSTGQEPDPALWTAGSATRVFVAGETTLIGGPTTNPYSNCTSYPGRYASVVQNTYRVPDPRAHLMVYDANTTFNGCRDPYGHYLEREFPAVLPGEAIQGQPQSIRVIGPTNSIMSVFASLLHAAPPIELPVGDIWLDPNLVVCVGSGAVDAQRHLTLTTRIPSWLPLGEVLVYQGVSLSPQSLWEISQPGFAVVREL